MLVFLVAAFLLAQSPGADSPLPPAPDCAAPQSARPPGILALCSAEESVARAALAPPEVRAEHWRLAAADYERAYELLQTEPERVRALEMLVRLHDFSHLNDPGPAERALRRLTALTPFSPIPVMRLARFQEERRHFDEAEQTLFGARPQHAESSALLGEMSRYFARRVMAMFEAAAPAGPRPPQIAALDQWRPHCGQTLAGAPGSAVADLCRAESEMRRAASAAALTAANRFGRGDSAEAKRAAAERTQALEEAARHYRRAAAALRENGQRAYVYEALARVYGSGYLNDPREAETALRALMTLNPAATGPVIRLARVQEDTKQIELAELTLMGARLQFPADVEVPRALSRFYARLTATASAALARKEREAERNPAPGQPDEQGFYQIGGDLPPPRAVEKPQTVYPDDARAVELEGLVIVEIWVTEQGTVSHARVLRGIPMLEEAALAAVRTWRFQPAIVNGRPAPVRMTVTHNFTVK